MPGAGGPVNRDMWITSLWEDGTIHLPPAPLGEADDTHRARLARRNRDHRLVLDGDTIEFDTYPADPELTGMRTRIEFRVAGEAS